MLPLLDELVVENRPYSPVCYVSTLVSLDDRISKTYTISNFILSGLVNEILGEVRIDNVNIFGVDVLNVRRAISTISQDTLLFCGTVRQNLDPAEEYPDHVLTKIIDTVDLTEKVSQLGGLDGQIEARGANISKE